MMADILYIIETQDFMSPRQSIMTVMTQHPEIPQFKMFNAWGFFQVPQQIGPFSWLVLLYVVTIGAGGRKQADWDAIANQIMQAIKLANPSNIVVGINIAANELPTLS